MAHGAAKDRSFIGDDIAIRSGGVMRIQEVVSSREEASSVSIINDRVIQL